jgi:hypothetical protein
MKFVSRPGELLTHAHSSRPPAEVDSNPQCVYHSSRIHPEDVETLFKRESLPVSRSWQIDESLKIALKPNALLVAKEKVIFLSDLKLWQDDCRIVRLKKGLLNLQTTPLDDRTLYIPSKLVRDGSIEGARALAQSFCDLLDQCPPRRGAPCVAQSQVLLSPKLSSQLWR